MKPYSLKIRSPGAEAPQVSIVSVLPAGKTLTIDTWGASAPGDRIFKEYGFTVENASQLYKSL